MEWLMESAKSSVQMACAWTEIPHWQLTYIQCHCYMNLFGRTQQETMFHIHSHCHKAPPSLSTYGSRWTEIPYYIVLRRTSTLNILPQFAVKKQWHYVGVCLYTNQTHNKHCTMNYPTVHWSLCSVETIFAHTQPSTLPPLNSCSERWRKFENFVTVSQSVRQPHNILAQLQKGEPFFRRWHLIRKSKHFSTF